jgi:hypothetical protein
MNYLVFLDAGAGELEKILSGFKCMVIKEFDPAQPPSSNAMPGDKLYFLRNKGECDIYVEATVIRSLFIPNDIDDELSQPLKELQARLQLTEDQYNYWKTKKQVQLVEFKGAQKIDIVHISPKKVIDKSDWIVFDELSFLI